MAQPCQQRAFRVHVLERLDPTDTKLAAKILFSVKDVRKRMKARGV